MSGMKLSLGPAEGGDDIDAGVGSGHAVKGDFGAVGRPSETESIPKGGSSAAARSRCPRS